MIVTVAPVTDPDRFLGIFRTVGARKRREHGCRSASLGAGHPNRNARRA